MMARTGGQGIDSSKRELIRPFRGCDALPESFYCTTVTVNIFWDFCQCFLFIATYHALLHDIFPLSLHKSNFHLLVI